MTTPYQERAALGHGSLEAGVTIGCGRARVSIVDSARIVTRTGCVAFALVIEFSFAADATSSADGSHPHKQFHPRARAHVSCAA